MNAYFVVAGIFLFIAIAGCVGMYFYTKKKNINPFSKDAWKKKK